MEDLRRGWHRFLHYVGIRWDYTPVIEQINGGLYLVRKDLLDDMMTKIFDQDETREKLFASVTCNERIEITEKFFKGKKLLKCLKPFEKILTKNEEIAILFKALGDEYKDDKENRKKALRYYNLALLFVPSNGTHGLIGEIYGSRSTVLLRLGEKDVSLRDIQLAFDNGCSRENAKAMRLYTRNLQLTTKIHNDTQKEQGRPPNVQRINNEKFRDEKMFHLEEPNAILQAGSNHIRLACDKEKGRQILTNTNVDPGTTIIVEEPFVCVLNNMVKWEFGHCVKCFKKIRAIIPCPNCVFASYCTEECRIEDLKNGHKYECGCMPFLHTLRVDPFLHLSLKAICKVGPESLLEYMKARDASPDSADTELIEGINPETNKYDSDSYYQILKLKSHVVNTKLPSLTWTVMAIMTILEEKTDFYKDVGVDGDFKMKFKKYVSSLLLQHGISFPYNIVGLTENRTAPGAKRTKKDDVQILTGVYPLISMMNHSCDANVFWQNMPNGKIAVVVNRTLHPGEELTFSYGYDYNAIELYKRRYGLKDYYKFHCKCQPCAERWPLFKDCTETKWFCPFCREHFRFPRAEFAEKCVLHKSGRIRDDLHCYNCDDTVPLKSLKASEVINCRELWRADRLIVVDKKPLVAYPILLECIKYFEQYTVQPSTNLVKAQELLRDVYELVVQN